MDAILGQCMYFGLSFSKIGCDFRSLMVPIFVKAISNNFRQSVHKATKNFEKNMDRFTLINKNHPSIPWKTKTDDILQPPDSLLEFYPLAEYLNQILTAFNALRLCPAVSVVNVVVEELNDSLLIISKGILFLYGQEQQAFTTNSKDAFTRLCMGFSDELVPFLQKCIHGLFPPNLISSHIGISIQVLQSEGITMLNKNLIIEPIKHLLPVKVDPVLSSSGFDMVNSSEEVMSKSTDDENVTDKDF